MNGPLARRARRVGLALLGGFHPDAGDGAPPGCGTLLLVGPDPVFFWDAFVASPEGTDGGADPLDRWSTRVVGGLAADHGATALFPFGGPPYQPFLSWARRSGSAWTSPVGLLVHERLGLFVSYRGALALAERLALPTPGPCPCETCAERPCLDACPVNALGGDGYDVPVCHHFLDTNPGRACMTKGCAVRRACPVAPGPWPRAQSAFHMAAFHGTQVA